MVRNSKSCPSLERAKERELFLWSLERAVLQIHKTLARSSMVAWKLMSTYTELGRRVDELEVDLLKIPTRSVNHERLADGDDTLLGSGDGALQHEVVILDDTVVRETTHGGNVLLGDVVFSRGVGFVVATVDTVDLFVEFRTVVVTVYVHRLVHGQRLSKLECAYFDQHGQPRT